MYKHAVLSEQNDYFRVQSIDESLTVYAPTLEKLHSMMEECRIDVLWAMPGESFSRTIRAEHFAELTQRGYNVYVPEELRTGKRLYGARIRSLEKRAFNRFFMFPENREWKVPQYKDKGVWHVEESMDLLRTVYYLEAEYGVLILWSPSHVGMACLKKVHEDQGVDIRPLPGEQVKEWNGIAKEICNWVAWAREPEQGLKYIVGYDKNAQFLGSAQSVLLGNGGYRRTRHTERVGVAQFWQYGNLGYVASSVVGRGVLPAPIPYGEGWAHVDLLSAAMQVGAQFDLLECVYWEESSKYLSRWSKDMWEHRAHFQQAVAVDNGYANAASTAKMIPNTLVGRLANASSGVYFHPDWNRAIVNRATANQAYSLLHIYREFGIAPCLVSKDAFYIATNESNPEKAIPGLLEHRYEQRGYKCVGVCELTTDIRHAFLRVNERRFGVAGIEGTIGRAMRDGR